MFCSIRRLCLAVCRASAVCVGCLAAAVCRCTRDAYCDRPVGKGPEPTARGTGKLAGVVGGLDLQSQLDADMHSTGPPPRQSRCHMPDSVRQQQTQWCTRGKNSERSPRCPCSVQARGRRRLRGGVKKNTARRGKKSRTAQGTAEIVGETQARMLFSAAGPGANEEASEGKEGAKNSNAEIAVWEGRASGEVVVDECVEAAGLDVVGLFVEEEVVVAAGVGVGAELVEAEGEVVETLSAALGRLSGEGRVRVGLAAVDRVRVDSGVGLGAGRRGMKRRTGKKLDAVALVRAGGALDEAPGVVELCLTSRSCGLSAESVSAASGREEGRSWREGLWWAISKDSGGKESCRKVDEAGGCLGDAVFTTKHKRDDRRDAAGADWVDAFGVPDRAGCAGDWAYPGDAAGDKQEEGDEAAKLEGGFEGCVWWRGLQRQLELLKSSAQASQNSPSRAEHASVILAMDREKFSLAKNINELELSINTLDATYSRLKEELEQLESEDVMDETERMTDDSTLLRLKIYRMLGIDLVEDDAGGYTKAIIRNKNNSDVHAVSIEPRYSHFFYSNYLWDLIST
ncbi:hypothetical protein PMAC_000171 [Pneumocystis sp. 'macacae']|nr:hypothetical protein PMAC_000171 [Pneumocystis sp. 'macacae']